MAIRKKTGILVGVSLITIGLLLEPLAISLLGLPQMGSHHPLVVGVPPGIPDYTPRPAYTGPHPAQLSRPAETYPFPIKLGEVGPKTPLFSGPLQYPWICMTEKSGLGQPIVDNQQRIGIPVYEENGNGEKTGTVIGYSKDCLIATRARYYYNRIGTHKFYPMHEAQNDIAQVEVNGKTVDFIIRVEIGTINRFIYVINVLKGTHETLDRPNPTNWNRKLIYQFRGGIGIGYKQGKNKPTYIAERRFDALSKGYAVIYSTANQTSNTYNISLQEDTALRVKHQFTALYGQPDFTMGIGGSGGAIQQYLLAQNHPGLLDGIIPLYSYPDMITQTIHGLDCELLEYYFDVQSRNPLWRDWEKRQWIEGLNGNNQSFDYFPWYQLGLLLQGQSPFRAQGVTECGMSWRGPAQLVMNPHYFHYHKHFPINIFSQFHWTYWQDMPDVYGIDQNGYANRTWDNVGVQYGLSALRSGKIDIETFLDINRRIGGWKPSEQQQPARFWLLSGYNSSIFEFSPWSEHNMTLNSSDQQTPAPRTTANLDAIRGAYRAGHVFLGQTTLPILDVRHYNDPELDMHHSFASLSARARIQAANGNSDNQVIWVTRKPDEPRPEAIDAMAQWLQNMNYHPERSAAENKPENLQDSCFDAQGKLLAKGPHVWDGDWNEQPHGACTTHYPPYQSSRNVAGSPRQDMIFKCYLQSVDSAIQRGLYSPIDISHHKAELKTIFPDGVCDYTRGDQGWPWSSQNIALQTKPN
ncbi:MAG: DUF6351 family protein [Pseudomonadales bacterium]|nr:DUF6351 family protein [Pseudomonadales bacterium]